MATLASLCGTNRRILLQKLQLIDSLVRRHGTPKAMDLYKSACPLVGASIGQHVRHSMDHMELAILVASTTNESTNGADLHYDLRVRGGTLEHDMNEAKKRITRVADTLESLEHVPPPHDRLWDTVRAHFMLSGDGNEFPLNSTIGRELGFAAHHAIHHMAVIKLIALNHAGLDGTDLAPDFGRAPSTVHHDKQEQ